MAATIGTNALSICGLWVILLISGWLTKDVAANTFNILIVYDDPSDAKVDDILAYLNMSTDCMNACEFPTSYATNPTKSKDELSIEFVGLPVNQTNTREIFCDAVSLHAQFVISVCKSVANRKLVKELASGSLIPVVQVQYAPWTYKTAAGASNMTTESVNYATMVPPNTVFLNVLPDALSEMNMTKRVTVLYDSILDRKDATWKSLFARLPLELRFVRLKTNDTDIVNQLASLKSFNPKVETILMIGRTRNIETYMQEAKDVIDAGRFKWFVFTTDVTDFLCHECSSVQVFWIRPDMESGDSDFMRIRLLKSRQDTQEIEEGIEPLRRVTGDVELRVSFYLDLITLAWDFMRTTSKQTPIYPVYGCFNQTMSMEDGNRTITLQEIMDTQPSSTFGPWTLDETKNNWYFPNGLGKFVSYWYETEQKWTKMMGNWTATDGVSTYYSSLMQDVRSIDVYRVVTIIQPPFVEKAIDPSTGKTIFRGYCIDLIEEIKFLCGAHKSFTAKILQKKLTIPFSYVLYEVPDGLYGTMNDRDEWNGMIGELVKGEADIALGTLSVMAERENFVDFTVPYYDLVGTTILMRRPEETDSLFEFIDVLEPEVWLCIIAAYFFTSFLLWVFDRFSPYSYTNNKEKYVDDPEKREFTFKECLWFCMTSLTPQETDRKNSGGGEAPKNISGRLVAATWWLFGFIIIASYTANLAAFLTVARLDNNIKGLDDLYKQYKVKYAPMRGSASETYFRRMAEIEAKFYDLWKEMSLNDSMDAKERAKLAVWDYPVSDKFTNMWRFMQESELPETVQDGVERVLASSKDGTGDGFAYIGDATAINYACLIDCRLQQVGAEFSRKPYAIAVGQNSPLKDSLSKAILQLLNERQLERLREKWWTNNPNKAKCDPKESQSEGISIKNIGGVFIVILGGIVLSIITLLFEYYYYKHKPERDAKTGSTQIQHVQPMRVTNKEKDRDRDRNREWDRDRDRDRDRERNGRAVQNGRAGGESPRKHGGRNGRSKRYDDEYGVDTRYHNNYGYDARD